MISFDHEIEYWKNGYTVIGIDEVGRGCLAGPLTIGAIGLPPIHSALDQNEWLSIGINDSKKLSEKKRKTIYQLLKKKPVRSYTVSVSVPTINTMGIMNAWRLGVAKIHKLCRLDFPNDTFTFLVDGPAVEDIPYTEEVKTVSIVKGDTKSIAIAAASILAKVERDSFMTRLSLKFPQYAWHNNKGYGTTIHRQAIRQFGITPWHRTLFVRTLMQL